METRMKHKVREGPGLREKAGVGVTGKSEIAKVKSWGKLGRAKEKRSSHR